MKRPDLVVREAAVARVKHMTALGISPDSILAWSTLTDAQKVPWIVQAAGGPC